MWATPHRKSKTTACKNDIFLTVLGFQKQNIIISRGYSVTYTPSQHSEFLVAHIQGNPQPSTPTVILTME